MSREIEQEARRIVWERYDGGPPQDAKALEALVAAAVPEAEKSLAGQIRLVLPWPDKLLSPNARIHWAKKAKLVKAARASAWWLTLAQPHQDRLRVALTGSIALDVRFCPPDKRRRDLDNCIASFKASSDGIADGIGVDDSRFVSTYQFGEPVKGGAVHVIIRGR